MAGLTLPMTIALAGLIANVQAASTQECCNLVSSISLNVLGEDAQAYETERTDFWSTTAWLRPSCVFMPQTSSEVAEAVQIMVENDCQLSVKGGGHSTIPGAANIDDGVLMAMKHINTTEVNIEEGYIRVGSGALFQSIYDTLDPLGLAAIVGRVGVVGMGMAVGAGISYFTNELGLVVDNVVAYEMVLANGTFVEVSSTQLPDLFWAMKGGNNNFGVVTHLKLRTIETAGAVFGGVITYPEASLDDFGTLLYDYHVRQAVEAPKTHVLPQYYYNGTTNTVGAVAAIVYNDDVETVPEIQQGWMEIDATSNTVQRRETYADLVDQVRDTSGDGLVQEQRTLTIYADEALMKDFWQAYHAWLQQYQHIQGLYAIHVQMPITPRAVAQGYANGGNALGFDPAENRTLSVIVWSLSIDNIEDTEEILPAHREFISSMEEMASSRGLLHPYIMLTYSAHDQPAIASYGEENVQRLQEIRDIYDPGHVFKTLIPGGQKLQD
ncbi:hypothetical protein B0I35DRAFT_414683 [Stachybotrys elegans]|uniref:FAD-binding PCMH-type domain-containing protein n=1 Tax=Stachybotrys elegans TaxID=80388 RepID=A0A8K0WJN8_9HYPO|nr:hypothetical protein B0I35DRAFT_414683 [Stachybotrys elegans]